MNISASRMALPLLLTVAVQSPLAAHAAECHVVGSAVSVLEDDVAIVSQGRCGLWRLEFRDGTSVSAADVESAGGLSRREEGDRLYLDWKSDVADVSIAVRRNAKSSIDLQAEVVPKEKESMKLWLPAELRFPAEVVRDFVYPGQAYRGLGMAFNEKFFRPVPGRLPVGWDVHAVGGDGYAHLYGGGPNPIEPSKNSVPLRPSPGAGAWLGKEFSSELLSVRRPVSRTPADGQADIVLVDSEVGPECR